MTNVLVTGGAGYIGAHTCKALSQAGYTPIAYDNLSNGHRKAVRWGPLEIGDILDKERLEATFRQWRPQAVIHFAGLIEVGRSVAEPLLFYRHNVDGSRCLLEAMAAFDVAAIVFSSSAAVYGEPENTPIPETHPLRPVNPYGRTKLAVEQMLADAAAASELRFAALRYFNAAGADPEHEIGERHEPETHALPLAILSGLGERQMFEIFGTDYATPDGTAIRDFVHVSDLAQAHVCALRHLHDGGASDRYNIGTGIGVSVRELVTTVEKVLGREVPNREAPRRAGDPAVLVATPAKAMAELDWQPETGDFETIVKTAMAWHEATV